MLIDNQKGVPSDVYTKNPRYWRYTEWNKLINNLMFSRTIGTNIRIKGNVFHESYNNVLDSYDDDSFMSQEMKYAFRSTYDDHSFGINLIGDVEFINTGITRLSFAFKKDVHKEEGNFNSGFSRYEASVLSSGIEQDINLSQSISAVLGISYDLLTPIFADNSELRSKSYSLNYLAGISYRTSKSLSFNINASKKSRFPTLKEFYSETVGRDLANPNLTIEQSVNSEIGFTYSLKSNIIINSSLFYSSIDDLINQVFLGEGMRQFQNIGKAEIKGLEIGLNYNNENYNFNLAYTYLSAINLSENRESFKLENRPEHILSFFTDYNFLFGTQIRGEFLFIANKIGVDSDTRKFVKMDDYLLTNIKISHDYLNNYLVYFRVNNLFNIYYESDYGYPQRGIEFIIGLKANF
jgi:iron complex outermembrane receptor protein